MEIKHVCSSRCFDKVFTVRSVTYLLIRVTVLVSQSWKIKGKATHQNSIRNRYKSTDLMSYGIDVPWRIYLNNQLENVICRSCKWCYCHLMTLSNSLNRFPSASLRCTLKVNFKSINNSTAGKKDKNLLKRKMKTNRASNFLQRSQWSDYTKLVIKSRQIKKI